MKVQTLKILMTGFDLRTLKSFEIFFQNKCNGEYVIADDLEDVPIAIVDLDAVNGMSQLQRLREKSPDQLILAVSILDRQDDNPRTLTIKKPLNHQELKQQLSSLRKAIAKNDFACLPVNKPRVDQASAPLDITAENTIIKPLAENSVSHSTTAASLMTIGDDLHFVGTNEDINLSDAEALEKILYSPAQRYQSRVIKAVNHARKTGKIVELNCLNSRIVIDPAKNIVTTEAGDSLLRPICILKVESVDTLTKYSGRHDVDKIFEISNRKTPELKKCSTEAFIWKIALWSSRGCIPQKIDLYSPVFLSSWPNFPRLETFPHAMRISALLVQRATMPGEIAKQLDIPQRYVFSFLSAVQALGLLRLSRRNVDQTVEPGMVRIKVAPRSLLKKLLGRLVGSVDKHVVVS